MTQDTTSRSDLTLTSADILELTNLEVLDGVVGIDHHPLRSKLLYHRKKPKIPQILVITQPQILGSYVKR